MLTTGIINKAKGERVFRSKLKSVDILKIRDLYNNNVYNTKELAKIYNIPKSIV
jgi:hypothetical protein